MWIVASYLIWFDKAMEFFVGFMDITMLQSKRSIKDAGNPAEFQGNWWKLISGGWELMVANPSIYQLLLSTEISDSLENLIMKDIHRTLPSQELFQVMDGPGQRSLHNFLKAYVVYDWCRGIKPKTIRCVWIDIGVFMFSISYVNFHVWVILIKCRGNCTCPGMITW